MKQALVLGPGGTNGHLAAQEWQKNHPEMRNAEIVFCRSNREIADGVASGRADFAVVPIQNNTHGAGGLISDLCLFWLRQDKREFNERGFGVIGEMCLPLSHCLLGRQEAMDLNGIKSVFSHPEAIKQCSDFLAFCGIAGQPSLSTAGAASQIAAGNDPTIGAIASEFTAEIYNLRVLKHDIQNDNNNSTIFHLIGRKATEPTGNDGTAVIIFIPNKSGALVRALQVIGSANKNMSSLVTINLGGIKNYAFYVEFDGHFRDGATSRMLHFLQDVVLNFVILGSFPRYQKLTKRKRN